MYCLVDIVSHSSGKVYAPKGAEVELVADAGICIFEYKGERYSCKRGLLGDAMPSEKTQIKKDSLGLF